MWALAASHTGALTPQTAQQRGLPVLLVQGGIHAGEIDGKDAGFLALRAALNDKRVDAPLQRQVLLFVPVFNVDGHERFGRWNRPNQRGPEAMGWRTTGQNFNLNRDYVKADAPEMQAMLALVNTWDPLAVIDLHVTDGAKFEHDVSIQIEPSRIGDASLQQVGKDFQNKVMADLARQGSLPEPFYYTFAVEDDPRSGFVDGAPSARFSHGYYQLRNRFGMLVEIHSWKEYPTRVKITRNTIESVLKHIAENGAKWRSTALQADANAAKLTGQQIPLSYKVGDKARMIDFRGYRYTREFSDVSGASMIRYDETKPEIWHVPVRDQVLPDVSIAVPQGGYIVPPAWAQMVSAKLAQHGIRFTKIQKELSSVAVEVVRAARATVDVKSYEGRQRLNIVGSWQTESRNIAANSLFIPTAQAKARLVLALFEPGSIDSLLVWGSFNNAFEKKEYMEAYVAEDVATAMLAQDPKVAQEFKTKLEKDPKFEGDPAARLEFFARRHPSWDERYNLYPVMRSAKILH